MSHGGLKRARSWKRRTQPKEAYTSPGLLYSELDTIILTPHSQTTRVYDVPGTQLSIYADTVGAAGTNGSLDVLIYGQY